MMDIILAPPIADIIILSYRIYDYLFLGFSQGNNQADLAMSRDVQNLLQSFFMDRADHAAAQPQLGGTEQNTLGCNAVIAVKGLADLCIIQDDNISGRALPFYRTLPVCEIACPAQAGKNLGKILKTRLQFANKIHAFFHLTNSTNFLFLFIFVHSCVSRALHPDSFLWLSWHLLCLWVSLNP